MCDFSLQSIKSRPAKIGDKLTTRDFGTGTGGFSASEDAGVAVCLRPGTELSRPTEQVGQQGMNQAQSLAVGGVDVGKQITNSIASVRTTLDGVSDVASAQAALPKLQEVTAQIDRTDSTVGQLSAEQRKLLLSLVKPLMPGVNQLCDKVLAIPGVAEVLKPSVDTLKTRLTAFAT